MNTERLEPRTIAKSPTLPTQAPVFTPTTETECDGNKK